MAGPEEVAVFKGGPIVWVVVIAVVIGVYIYKQSDKQQTQTRADAAIARAVAMMDSFQKGQQDRVLTTLAGVRSAKIDGSTDRIAEATAELEAALANSGVTYPRPVHLYHVSAVWDANAQSWLTDMYFAGKWVPTNEALNPQGQVQLLWAGTLKVICQVDLRHGPFSNSFELCPVASSVGLKLEPSMGCGDQ